MLGVLSSRLRDATEEQALSKMPNGWGRGALGGGGGVEGSQNRRRRASPSGAVCRAVGGTGLRTDDACRARSRQPLVPRRNSWVLRTVEWTGKLGRSHFYSYSTTTTSSSFGQRVGGGRYLPGRSGPPLWLATLSAIPSRAVWLDGPGTPDCVCAVSSRQAPVCLVATTNLAMTPTASCSCKKFNRPAA